MNLYLLEQTGTNVGGVFGLLIAAKNSKSARRIAGVFAVDHPGASRAAFVSPKLSSIRKIGENNKKGEAVIAAIAQR